MRQRTYSRMVQFSVTFILVIISAVILECGSQNVPEHYLKRERRADVAGMVITWNIQHIAKKLGRENSKPLSDVACHVIERGTVVALQEADKFEYGKVCRSVKYHEKSFGQYIILAEKAVYTSLTLDFKDNNFIIGLLTSSAGYSVTIVNTHLPQGSTESKKRQDVLTNIKKQLRSPKHDHLVIILGDFNTMNVADERELTKFQDLDGNKYKYIFPFDGKEPFTTPIGKVYDGILTNKNSGTAGKLPDEFPFENTFQFRFKKIPDARDSIILQRLINNWNVLKFSNDLTSANAVEKCIHQYIDKSSSNCPASWASSHSVSDHSPLLLNIQLPEKKSAKIGTWNINAFHLAKKLMDSKIKGLFKGSIEKFDILVLQEIPSGQERNLKTQFGIDNVQGDVLKSFKHGLRISQRLRDQFKNVKIKASFEGDRKDNKFAFYEIELVSTNRSFTVCLGSVHLDTNSPWQTIRSAVREYEIFANEEAKAKACDVFFTMGDFNSIKDGISDIMHWTQHGNKVKFAVTPRDCKDKNGHLYTRKETRHRLDYIFPMKLNTDVVMGTCDILDTGNEKTEVGDWHEVSDHYPIGARL